MDVRSLAYLKLRSETPENPKPAIPMNAATTKPLSQPKAAWPGMLAGGWLSQDFLLAHC